MTSQKQKAEKRSLWVFPWGYRESFLFLFGVMFMGYALQFFSGSIQAPAFPINLIALSILALLIGALHFGARQTSIVLWLRSVPFALSAITGLLLQSLVMGIVPQSNTNTHNPHDTFGLTDVMSSWPFVLIVFVLLVNLGLVTLHKCIPLKKNNLAFLLNHAGLWIVLASGMLGAGDLHRYTMPLEEGKTEWTALDGEVSREMPFAVQLNDFEMEEYPPKIALVNTTTNEIDTKMKNSMREITDQDEFSIGRYPIKILNYYPEARNVADRYEPVNDFGAAPAAKISCSVEGKDTVAWISCGSFASFPSLLRLRDSMALIMTNPEPKSFRSYVKIYTPERAPEEVVIEVNKPVSVKGWRVYQLSYDDTMGKYGSQSTLELVKDPWLPVVYIGVFLMILGAIWMIFRGAGKERTENEKGGPV